jgi:hypothetical protein
MTQQLCVPYNSLSLKVKSIVCRHAKVAANDRQRDPSRLFWLFRNTSVRGANITKSAIARLIGIVQSSTIRSLKHIHRAHIILKPELPPTQASMVVDVAMEHSIGRPQARYIPAAEIAGKGRSIVFGDILIRGVHASKSWELQVEHIIHVSYIRNVPRSQAIASDILAPCKLEVIGRRT